MNSPTNGYRHHSQMEKKNEIQHIPPWCPDPLCWYRYNGMCILLPKDPAPHPSVSVFKSQVGMLYPSTSWNDLHLRPKVESITDDNVEPNCSMTPKYSSKRSEFLRFNLCSGLTSIYVYAEKVPKIDSNVFKGCYTKKCTLYVPMGTRDDYRLSNFGYYFENIVEFEATDIDKTTTSTDVEEVARYSVNGQRLSAPTKGLNIVKYSDGSVKKVAVR